MSYLNGWDKHIPRLDVVDDYKSERQQILAVQDKSFPFSFGDVSDLIHELSFILLMFSMLLKFSWVVLMIGLIYWMKYQYERTKATTAIYNQEHFVFR